MNSMTFYGQYHAEGWPFRMLKASFSSALSDILLFVLCYIHLSCASCIAVEDEFGALWEGPTNSIIRIDFIYTFLFNYIFYIWEWHFVIYRLGIYRMCSNFRKWKNRTKLKFYFNRSSYIIEVFGFHSIYLYNWKSSNLNKCNYYYLDNIAAFATTSWYLG